MKEYNILFQMHTYNYKVIFIYNDKVGSLKYGILAIPMVDPKLRKNTEKNRMYVYSFVPIDETLFVSIHKELSFRFFHNENNNGN